MNWIETAHKLNIFHDGHAFHLKKTDPLFKKVMRKLNAEKFESVLSLLLPAKRIMNYTNQEFRVSNDGQVYLRGDHDPVHKIISEKLIAFSHNGLPYRSLISFWKNLKKNPDPKVLDRGGEVYSIKDQLYGFLTKNKHPITSDGCFIAYKHVNRNENGQLVDVKTGDFINNIGQVVQMKRKEVDTNPHNTCSSGLHVASFEYATKHYPGNVLITVLVNPRHVCAVPMDYNQQKMRVCEYTVIGIETEEIQKLYIPNTVIFKRTRESLKRNNGFSFKDMSASQIVSFVRNIAGEEIMFSLRSKRSIVSKAEEIFREKKLLAEPVIEEEETELVEA